MTLRDDLADWAAAVAALVDASPGAPLQLLRAFAGADEVPAADGEAGDAAWRPPPIASHLAHSFLVKCDQVRAPPRVLQGLLHCITVPGSSPALALGQNGWAALCFRMWVRKRQVALRAVAWLGRFCSADGLAGQRSHRCAALCCSLTLYCRKRKS